MNHFALPEEISAPHGMHVPPFNRLLWHSTLSAVITWYLLTSAYFVACFESGNDFYQETKAELGWLQNIRR